MSLVRKPGRVLGSVGDRSPFEYGGGVVYGGKYGPTLWWTMGLECEPPDATAVEVFRVELYRGAKQFLGWYDWVDWDAVATSCGTDRNTILSGLHTAQGRACALVEAFGYYGAREFDLEPTYFTHGQLGRRHW